MKKVIPAILLFIFFHSITEAQTVNERIQIVENNGINFVLKVQVALNKDSVAVGNAVSRIHFNPNVISFAEKPKVFKDYSFHKFLSNDYLSSVSHPSPGTVSINVVNLGMNPEKIDDKFTDLATLTFNVNSAFSNTGLKRGLQEYFAPFSTAIMNSGTLSISSLSEDYIPYHLIPFNNSVLGSKDVKFMWKEVQGADSYQLQISLDESFRQLQYSVDNITNTEVIVKDLIEGTKYFWRMRSIASAEQSHFSRGSSFIIAIEEPSDLNSTSPSNGQFVELNWQNNSVSAQYIVIERKESSSDYTDYSSIDTIDASRSSYIDALIEEDQSYIYRVRAINEHTASTSSDSTIITMKLSKIEIENEVPKDFQLQQNYPNPFNPTTTINYSVREDSHITITIYSLLGEKVSTLVSKGQNAGNYDVIWNASNYPSGIYIYIMTAESNVSENTFQNVKKMILLK